MIASDDELQLDFIGVPEALLPDRTVKRISPKVMPAGSRVLEADAAASAEGEGWRRELKQGDFVDMLTRHVKYAWRPALVKNVWRQKEAPPTMGAA